MKKIGVAVGVLVGVLALNGTAPGGAAKPRVAVLEFTETGAGGWSGNVGRAAETWFVDSLVNTQKFKVLERQQLQALLAEQHFQMGGEVSPATAVQVGKVAGVQVIVFGNVNFAQKEQELHTSGVMGLIKNVPHIWGSGSMRTSEGNLTARAVSVQTGEILFSKGETVSTSNFNLDILGTGGGTEWDETVARKVFQPAVEKLTAEMVAKIEGMKESLGEAATGGEGKVVALKDGIVLINLGRLDGVKGGDKFEVVRAEVIRDPDTNEVLGRDETPVGSIVVHKISGDHLSAAKILSGDDFSKGDVVKRP
ncbi:MAG: hypothetical protein HZB55_13880 [Deltaproteobacteria bacterium]|nr:hypothetical protein [Deltaproteobacteria bacterium]